MTRLERPLAGVALGYLVLLLALYVVESWFADAHWLLTTVAWAPQYPWLLGALPLAGLCIWAGSRAGLALCLAAAAFAAGVLMAPAWSPLGEEAEGQPLRVLTLNAGAERTSQGALEELLRRERPDVVTLQEVSPAIGASMETAPFEVGDLSFQVARAGEQAILSRVPILERKVHDLGFGTGRSVIETRLQLTDGEITVLGTHFFRGQARGTAGPVSRALADLTRSGAIHARQTERLLEISAGAPLPQIIAGDLNLPPRGPLYAALTERHRDAFRIGGWGYGYSFPASLPLLRIDYILAGSGLAVRGCHTLAATGSDHRGVLADLIVE